MNFLFSTPFALLGLAGLGILIGIYLLRNRFRQQTVSSLMLWEDHKKPRQGGLRFSRIQTPLLFLLELLAILLLALAAAGPLVRKQRETASYMIILDDSYSMLAGSESTAQQRAKGAILDRLNSRKIFRVQFILAGSEPRLLARSARSTTQVQRILEDWTCRSQTADLTGAVLLAMDLAGRSARVLVFTDHAPPASFNTEWVQWYSLGQPLNNLAFTEAAMGADNRCVLSVANLSDQPTEAQLILEAKEFQTTIHQETVSLDADQVVRYFFELENADQKYVARLSEDALTVDNEICLIRQRPKVIPLKIQMHDARLDEAVRRAVETSGFRFLETTDAQLLLTDTRSALDSRIPWRALFLSDPNARSYIGPFVMDHGHPLTEGLSLNGVIWAAADNSGNTRPAVIAAGNIPLVTHEVAPDGSETITIQCNPQLSTLFESPNWPILMWNLLNWRCDTLPGLDQSIYALGQRVRFVAPPSPENQSLRLIDPRKNEVVLPDSINPIQILPTEPGEYTIYSGQSEFPFAVNILSVEESDLRQAVTNQWGQPQDASLFRWEYQAIDWILLLTALGILMLHRWIHVKGGVRE